MVAAINMSFYTVTPSTSPLIGTARIPGDKSIGHRALLFGALADEPLTIQGLSDGQDNRNTRRAIEAMGVTCEDRPTGQLVVHGVGLHGLKAPATSLDCGNSGTSMRLLAGILAGQSFDSCMSGDHSLSVRPMRRVTDPLTQMGAQFRGESGRVAGELYPPIHVTGGPLHGIHYVQPMASAQVKSAILLAGLYAEGSTTVVEPAGSRNHTELMLAHMGAPISVDGMTIQLDPSDWNRSLKGGACTVPGDPSAAAFLVVAALVAGVDRVGVLDVCLNPRRTGFLDAIAKLGGRVERECLSQSSGEPVADLVVSRGAAEQLQGAVIAGDLTLRALDELPILAILAARASGVTDFRDAHELRFKESDRIATTCTMLKKLGVEVEEREDGFSVEGLAGAPFAACEIDAHGDHRIAMSAVVAGLAANGPVRVNDVDNVATSFPTFVSTFNNLGAQITVE